MKQSINSELRLQVNESIFLNIIRAAACEIVLIGHIMTYLNIYPHNGKIPYIQSMAVSVFFILSGFLAMYSYYNKKRNIHNATKYSVGDYLTNRFSRIYSTYFFALIFIAVIDKVSIHFMPEKFYFYNSYNYKSFFASLFMLQQFPLAKIFPQISFQPFGSAIQLWTLSIEWWCYIFFGLTVIGFQKYKKNLWYWVAVSLTGIVPLYNFIFGNVASVNSISYDGLSFTWFLGLCTFWVYCLMRKNNFNLKLKKSTAIPIFLAIMIAAWLRMQFVHTTFGINYDVLFSFIISALIIFGLQACKEDALNFIKVKKITNIFASFSFTLYLTHYSILDFATKLYSGRINIYLFGMILILICNIFAYFIALVCEKRLPKIIEKFINSKREKFQLIKNKKIEDDKNYE